MEGKRRWGSRFRALANVPPRPCCHVSLSQGLCAQTQLTPPSFHLRLMSPPVARTLEVLEASLGGVPSMAALCLALDLWVRAREA